MTNGDITNRLWAAADQLWANSGLRPSEFSTPVLGLLFLRYAEKRFADAEEKIGPVGGGGRRKIGEQRGAPGWVCRFGPVAQPVRAPRGGSISINLEPDTSCAYNGFGWTAAGGGMADGGRACSASWL